MAILSESGSLVVEPIRSYSLTLSAPNPVGSRVVEPVRTISLTTPVANSNASAPSENGVLMMLSSGTATYGIGPYYVTGFVKNGSNVGIARKVLAKSRATNNVLDETFSDATTGAFTLRVFNEDVYVVCIPNDGDNVNAEIYDKITPVASI